MDSKIRTRTRSALTAAVGFGLIVAVALGASPSVASAATPPDAPGSVGSTLSGDRAILIYWTGSGANPAGITGWNVYRFDAADPAGVLAGNTPVADPQFVDTGLQAGTAYTYAVAAVDANGEGPQSPQTATLTAQGVPDSPTGVTATLTNSGELTVTWNAPASDGGSPITGYTVYRSPTASDPAVAIGSTSTTDPLAFVDSGLTGGLTQYYSVVANNVWGSSTRSATSDALVMTTPSPPGDVVAAPLPGGVAEVDWSAPLSDGGSPISGYHVEALGMAISCDTTALTCHVSGLEVGRAYVFRVFATNALGSSASAYSDYFYEADVPGAPSITSITTGYGSATVIWNPPYSDGGGFIYFYTVTASPGGATCEVASNSSQCTVYGLKYGKYYTFTVTATSEVGTGPASEPNGATLPAWMPSAPRSLHATYLAGHKTTVTWVGPSNNGGASVTRYMVRWSSNKKKWTSWSSVGNKRAATHIGFRKGTKGYVQVVAVNKIGSSPATTLMVRPTK